MYLRRFFIGLLLTFILTAPVFALDIPAHDGYVTDLADVFSETEESELEAKIDSIEQETSVEIAVLTVSTTEDYTTFDYALEVGNVWGVGKSENDNGLVILVAVDDHDWFISTGYGLEGTLPDARAKRIGERYFPPNFREGNYAQGITEALDDIRGYLEADPTVIADYESSTTPSTIDDPSMMIGILIVLGFFLIPFKSIWVRKTKKKKLKSERSLFSNTGVFLIYFLFGNLAAALIMTVFGIITDWIDLSSTGGSSGSRGGGSGWKSSRSSSSSSWSSSSSSGSSFGGGSFGGGGAGGKW